MADPVADGVLLEAARAGDVDAFGTLVRRHQRRVYRVALRMLGSAAEAEDATQETFVQAWRGLARFRSEAAVSTWLYRIVTNRCLNMLDETRLEATLTDDLPGPGLDPVESAELHERFGAITRAVAALPTEQRAALVLRDFEGLSYEEIGATLKISLAAVKGRIHRARTAVLQETAAWR